VIKGKLMTKGRRGLLEPEDLNQQAVTPKQQTHSLKKREKPKLLK